MNGTRRNILDVKQITSLRLRWAHNAPGDGKRDSANARITLPWQSSTSRPQAGSRRWLITAFLIYATIVVGTLGFSLVFPDDMPHGKLVAAAHPQTAAKPARYEAVMANWNRYRARDASLRD